MSRPKLGVAVMTLFTIASVLFPGIDDRYRVPSFIISVLLLIAFCIWYFLAPKTGGNEQEARQHVEIIAPRQTGSILAAGRDVHQTFHQYPAQPKAQKLSHHDDLTPIEAIDDLLQTYNALEPAFAHRNMEPPVRNLEDLIDDTKACLRKKAPQYLPRFTEVVFHAPYASWPSDSDFESIDEWIKDTPRCRGWNELFAARKELERTRNELRSMLPS